MAAFEKIRVTQKVEEFVLIFFMVYDLFEKLFEEGASLPLVL